MNDEWQTPQDLFSKLNIEFGFDIDVAADEYNSLCEFWIGKDSNALNVDWCCMLYELGNYPTCFVNPPYSKPNITLFCKKTYEESQKGCTVVGLLPMDLSTKWYQNWIFGKAHEVRTIARRVRFVDPETGKKGGSPKFGSIIVVWKLGIPEYTKFSIYDW